MRSLNKQLFISKNDSEIDPFRSQFEELGFEVEGHSFLSFSGVEFEALQNYNVIFFGSPRAVIFFMEGSSIPEGVEVACIGDKTAELLESLGYIVSFRGETFVPLLIIFFSIPNFYVFFFEVCFH